MKEAMTFDGFLTESTTDATESRPASYIRNCLLCGLVSKNGRSFTAGSFGGAERAKALYEGVHVYLNHDLEAGPSRKVQELAGIVTNVRVDGLGRPRGDVLLGEGSAAGELRSLMKFSEKAVKHGAKLKDVGFSHVARYTFAAKDRKRVESVDEVFSCDLVVRPASTKSFKEAQGNAVPEPFDPSKALEMIGSDGGFYDLAGFDGGGTAIAAADSPDAQAFAGGFAHSIESDLQRAGLDPFDPDQCSRVFLEILRRTEDACDRAEMIADRAAVLAHANTRGTDGEFDALKAWNYFFKPSGVPAAEEMQESSKDEFDARKALKTSHSLNCSL